MSDILSGAGHPAPQRHQVAMWAIVCALALPPLGWLAVLLLDYGLATQACFPGGMPRLTASWAWVWPALAVVSCAGLIAAAAGGLISLSNWRRSQSETEPDNALLEGGEGRTRFLAMWGMLAGGGFVVAAAFNLVAVWGAPLCGLY